MRSRGSFLDAVRMFVKGGCGGHGLVKYGGSGGKGGDVVLEASKFKTLKAFVDRYPHRCVTAHNGRDSRRRRMIGDDGADKVVKVPVGVTVYGDGGGGVIGELNHLGERVTVARGGAGGGPESVPPYVGAKGQERTITLDLKLIADVGLVGFPNAGKSTLLKAISRANPKIASYAFTTLKPNVGVVEYDDRRQIQVADLPGLIEGAWKNLGMGHKFLKHVERTSMLLVVADVAGFRLNPASDPHRSCLDTIVLLVKELELYNEDLLRKPIVVAVNKMDLPNAEEVFADVAFRLERFQSYLKDVPAEIRPETATASALEFADVLPVSARYDAASVTRLKDAVRRVCDEHHLELTREDANAKRRTLEDEIARRNREVSAQSL